MSRLTAQMRPGGGGGDCGDGGDRVGGAWRNSKQQRTPRGAEESRRRHNWGGGDRRSVAFARPRADDDANSAIPTPMPEVLCVARVTACSRVRTPPSRRHRRSVRELSEITIAVGRAERETE